MNIGLCFTLYIICFSTMSGDQYSHRLHCDYGDDMSLDFLTPSTFAAITGSIAESERVIVRRWQGSRCWGSNHVRGCGRCG